MARAWASALLLAPALASAHAFVQPYSLPVPLSLYAAGSALALGTSFVGIALFASAPALLEVPQRRGRDLAPLLPQSVIFMGRGLALVLLWLSITAGFVGTPNPYANVNMTLFWIIFVLGVPYLCAVGGDLYSAVNPWRTLVVLLQVTSGVSFDRRRCPSIGYAAGISLYIAFIWLELFGNLTPSGLSRALLAYTFANIAGAYVWGKEEWFEKSEFFGVINRIVGSMAPVTAGPSASGTGTRLRWRAPFVGVLQNQKVGAGLTLFILFMLSSTAYDGLHSTSPWVTAFWKHIYPHLEPFSTLVPRNKYELSARLYYVWQWISMALSPLVYLLVFTVFMRIAKSLTGTTLTITALVNRFAVTIVPIALAYHVTHYYTMFLMQAGQIVRLVSDPFGAGWNIFGTADLRISAVMVSADAIWHSQVAIILVGHIASVYLAHVEALRVFGSRGAAVRSQVPLLVLMVLFTVLGLWILSLPLATA